MRWAAFDFETATNARDSACAIGVVVVDDGAERARQAWLIRPPGNRYSGRNVAIHGITPGDTECAPDFPTVWSEVQQLVDDRPLVAHNAAFDTSVLNACTASHDMVVASTPVWCSVRLARRVWPQLGRWNLPRVCEHLGIDLRHHDALSDALACSRIISACLAERAASGLDALGTLLDVAPRMVGSPAPARVW